MIKWQAGLINPADAPSRRPDYIAQNEDAHEENASRRLLATLEAKVARVQQIRTSRRRVLKTHDRAIWTPGKTYTYGSESGRQAK